jgi:hypothetical protein
MSKKKTKAVSVPAKQGTDLQARFNAFLPYLNNFWIIIPALLFFKVVFDSAVNLPIKDDYDAILNFILDFRSASFSQKIALLFSQHNEHRIFHSRLIYVTYYMLFGEINFRHLILIGDLQLVIMFAISVYFIRKATRKYWNILALIWGLAIFDLNTYENGDVAMTAIQNYGIVMLFFVTLLFYSQDKKKYLIPAALFHVICIFSSGNGIVASIFIVLYTLLGTDKLKKIMSASIAVVFSLLYFVHYVKPTGETLAYPSFRVDVAITFILKMVGAPIDFDMALIWGCLVLILLAVAFPYKRVLRDKNLLPLLIIAAFCLATMVAAGYFRSNQKGSSFNASRYLIYPQLLLASLSLFIFLKFEEKKQLLPVAVVLLLISLKVYSGNYKFGKAGFVRESARATYYKYYYPDASKAKIITTKALDAGIYSLEEER